MGIFNELLTIKRFREDKAELAMVRQRVRHAKADSDRGEAQRRLQEFRQDSERQERALYQDLCSRIVRVRDIENVMQNVAGMREGERQCEHTLDDAEKSLQTEAQALLAARDSHNEASRLTQKFVELAETHCAAELQESERKEDLEMEEAAAVLRDRGDWEQHEDFEPT